MALTSYLIQYASQGWAGWVEQSQGASPRLGTGSRLEHSAVEQHDHIPNDHGQRPTVKTGYNRISLLFYVQSYNDSYTTCKRLYIFFSQITGIPKWGQLQASAFIIQTAPTRTATITATHTRLPYPMHETTGISYAVLSLPEPSMPNCQLYQASPHCSQSQACPASCHIQCIGFSVVNCHIPCMRLQAQLIHNDRKAAISHSHQVASNCSQCQAHPASCHIPYIGFSGVNCHIPCMRLQAQQ